MIPHTRQDPRIARTIGILFLVAMLAYGTGSGLVESVTGAPDVPARAPAHETRIELGAILMLVNSIVVAGIGVLLVPVLRGINSVVAYGYLAARIVEATLLAIGVTFLLLLPQLGSAESSAATSAWQDGAAHLAITANDTAYQVAMLALAAGSVPLCILLLRARLVPRPLAAWGIAGYAIFLAGAVLELFDVRAGLLLSIPGGLFELALGLWLILRGFGHHTVPAPTGPPASASVPRP